MEIDLIERKHLMGKLSSKAVCALFTKNPLSARLITVAEKKPPRFLNLILQPCSMKALTNYLRECANELKLVTWPKQEELLRLTIITVIFVLITAVILAIVDFGFLKAYQWLLAFGVEASEVVQ